MNETARLHDVFYTAFKALYAEHAARAGKKLPAPARLYFDALGPDAAASRPR